MAKVKLLVDTDIFIDALKEIKPAKELFRVKEADLYCSFPLRSSAGMTGNWDVEPLACITGKESTASAFFSLSPILLSLL